jgi:hypothetical protein
VTEIQLDAALLHALARDPKSDPPAAFASANEDIERTRRLYDHAVWHRHDLIKAARDLGVPWTALSRWTGLNRRSLDRIVNER